MSSSSARRVNSQYDSKDSLEQSHRRRDFLGQSRSRTDPREQKEDEEREKKDHYVNAGYERWLTLRQQWRTGGLAVGVAVGGGGGGGRASPLPQRTRPIDPDEIAERIFRVTNGPIHLPYPVPLPDMVEILTEAWEAEGLSA
eukprot:gene4095-4485_t